MAHNETIAKMERQLKQFMPGDSHKNLQYRTELAHEVIDFVLLPVWSYAVRYADDQPPIQILVNGQTGSIGGKVPISATKVTLVVVAAVVLIGLFVLLMAVANQ